MILTVQVALNGLENILRLGEQESKQTGKANPYAVIIEEVFGLDKIEFLQSHENMEIYQKAFDIIEHYFGSEEEDKDVSLTGQNNIFTNNVRACLLRCRLPLQLTVTPTSSPFPSQEPPQTSWEGNRDSSFKIKFDEVRAKY